ncbi:MAG: hypothetical protein A2161_09145 [Candidatus Schekmanbacteria bacterium RBG_13_48_7]|uniref:Uncharacterized protein n=1 Tax=Candidatus Schekmanbacteria bacterium RBG_13_48_7 TaxID=1817878 RepID=A0A1F7S2T9_9BACT|nr:MAG: hypothetical protein A2161_09145 [Candidatus Schekmanbacteria bacterium RBG_13_48_7]
MEKYKCSGCQKEYKYRKANCSVCGGLLEENNPIADLSKKASEKITEKKQETIELDEKETYAQLEKDINSEIAKENKEEPFKKLTAQEFISSFKVLPDFVNGILNEIPKDSEYYDLAQIWVFTEKEITEIFTLIYDILDLYFPSVFKYLDKASIISIALLSITVIWIFTKKGIATYKFFKNRKTEIVQQVNMDGEKEVVIIDRKKRKKIQ